VASGRNDRQGHNERDAERGEADELVIVIVLLHNSSSKRKYRKSRLALGVSVKIIRSILN
jgi:hypothetical protein